MLAIRYSKTRRGTEVMVHHLHLNQLSWVAFFYSIFKCCLAWVADLDGQNIEWRITNFMIWSGVFLFHGRPPTSWLSPPLSTNMCFDMHDKFADSPDPFNFTPRLVVPTQAYGISTLWPLGEGFAWYVCTFIMQTNDFLREFQLYDLLASVSRDTLS